MENIKGWTENHDHFPKEYDKNSFVDLKHNDGGITYRICAYSVHWYRGGLLDDVCYWRFSE